MPTRFTLLDHLNMQSMTILWCFHVSKMIQANTSKLYLTKWPVNLYFHYFEICIYPPTFSHITALFHNGLNSFFTSNRHSFSIPLWREKNLTREQLFLQQSTNQAYIVAQPGVFSQNAPGGLSDSEKLNYLV